MVARSTLYIIANVASLGILSLVEEKWNQESKATYNEQNLVFFNL